MDGLFFDVLLFLFGLGLLVKGADILVDRASKIAKRFGVSEFMIGLTIVALGTTVPELGASTISSLMGNAGIAIGNILGSVIFNLAFILALTAIFIPVKVSRQVYFDSIVLLSAAILFCFLCLNGVLSRIEGVFLILLFAARLAYFAAAKKLHGWEGHLLEFLEKFFIRSRGHSSEAKNKPREKEAMHSAAAGQPLPAAFLLKSAVFLAVSVAFVFFGTRFMVESASRFPINPLFTGLILVSVGTSLPELAVAITCIRKKLPAITIGDIIGANISDLLWVGGAAAIAKPMIVPVGTVLADFVFMVFLLALFLLFIARDKSLGRKRAALLLLLYFAYFAATAMTKLGA